MDWMRILIDFIEKINQDSVQPQSSPIGEAEMGSILAEESPMPLNRIGDHVFDGNGEQVMKVILPNPQNPS